MHYISHMQNIYPCWLYTISQMKEVSVSPGHGRNELTDSSSLLAQPPPLCCEKHEEPDAALCCSPEKHKVHIKYKISNSKRQITRGSQLYLFEEEMIGEVIEHHRIAGVNGVGSGKQLHAVLDGVGLFIVELQHSQTHQCSHTFGVELQSSAKRQASFLQFVELDEAVAHAQSHLGCNKTITKK